MTALRKHPMAALAVLALGLFMTLLDLTIVNVAIPSILEGLHASLDQVLWVLNAYSLFYAVLLITSARLGDIYGPRNMFAAGVVIFTVASAFSGLAQDPTQLIVFRAAQGFGAAVLAPQGLPLMISLFPPQKRGGVFAIYGTLAGLAVIAGPTVGGLLVTHFGWRSIFTVNIPIGVVTFALALLLIPDLRARPAPPVGPGRRGACHRGLARGDLRPHRRPAVRLGGSGGGAPDFRENRRRGRGARALPPLPRRAPGGGGRCPPSGV